MIYILGFAVFIAYLLYACCVVAGRADDASERYFNERHKNRPKN